MARTVTITLLGNTKDLEASLTRAGLVAQDTSEKIATSYRSAGRAAADFAAQTGASADEQAAAAGRAAAAWTEASAKMSAAQKAAGDAAAQSAQRVGASLDEQQVAYDRAVAAQGRYEAATAKTAKASADAAAHAKNLTDSIASVGKWATVGLAAAGAASVDLASKFQTSTARIAGASDISVKAATQIGNAFLGTAFKSIYSGQQMSQAFASVAGQLRQTEGRALGAGQALTVMNAAGDLAEATGSSLGDSTSALAAVMQAYSLRVSQAAGASDALFNVSRSLNVPVGSVATAVDKLHGRLGDLAPSLRDVTGLMVELGSHGIQGSRGVTVVNTALQTLIGGSQNTAAVLDALGVHLFDANGKFIGLQGAIAQLQPKFAQMTQQQQDLAAKTLFGSSAAQVMLGIIQQGPVAFGAATDAAGRLGTAHKAAADQSQTLQHQLEMVKAGAEDLAVKFGQVLIPALQAVTSWVSTSVGWLQQHRAAAEALAGVVSVVLGGAMTVFAYTKAVAFVNATKGMVAGIQTFAKWIGIGAADTVVSSGEIVAANETAGGSFALLGTDAAAGVAEADVSMGTLAVTAESTSAAIVTANEAAGASFTALLGPIGLAAAAIAGLGYGVNAAAKAFGGSSSVSGADARGGYNFGASSSSNLSGASSQSSQLTGSPTGVRSKYLPGTYTSNYTPTSFAVATMLQLGITPTTQNIKDFTAWEQQEGGNWNNTAHYNPLNTTLHTGAGAGAPIMSQGSSAGVRSYSSWAQGIQATAQTLQSYSGILAALRGNASLSQFSAAVSGSPWGTGGISTSGVSTSNAALQKILNQIGAGTVGKTTAAKTIRSLLYSNPFAGDTGITQGRQDMGVDFSAPAGSAIHAIGAGTITDIIANWYKGQPLVEEQLTSGPDKGKMVYYAEQLNALVKQGQKVQAGQTIARVAGSGTGLELGFGGPHGLTAAQAAGDQWEANPAPGQSTPHGSAFQAFLKAIGQGVYTSTKAGVTTGGTSSSLNSTQAIAAALQKVLSQLNTSGTSLLTRYGNVQQSGTVKTLEALTGANAKGLNIFGNQSSGTYLASGLAQISARSQQGKAFDTLITQLREAHTKALTSLADRLVAAHKAALDALGNELQAAQLQADARMTTLQATELKDQTTLIATMAANVVQGVKDATQSMSDTSSAAVTQISDQSQTATDTLAERGLYGLNLQAQQQQVAFDNLKTGWDQQVAQAQQTIDTVTAATNQSVGAAQQHLDQVTQTTDAAVQKAQNADDAAATASKSVKDVADAALAKAQAAASLQQNQANDALQAAQNAANLQIAQAQQAYQSVQDNANVAEAQQQAIVQKIQAEASTQYAGSGLTVNIYGLPTNDAAAISTEFGWIYRTQIPT